MVPEWDLNCHASRTIMREGKKEKRGENRSYIYMQLSSQVNGAYLITSLIKDENLS